MKKILLSMLVLGGAIAANAQTGSADAPLSVDDILKQGIPASAVADTYVQGYIVGYVDGKSLQDGANFKVEGAVATNLLLADSSSENNLEFCIPVQLPSGNIRNELNLAANPQNFGHEVMLCGSHEKYFGANGMKNISSYKWIGEAPVAPVTPPPSVEETGTEAAPLSVAAFLKLPIPAKPVENTWIEGYIVGYVPAAILADAVFGATAPEGSEVSKSNMLIADAAGTTDVAQCVPVQIPANAIRDGLNLQANPGNLGKKVVVCGNRTAYFGVDAIKETHTYILDGNRVTVNDNPGGETATVKSVAATIALASKTKTIIDYPLTVAFVNGKNIFACDAAGDFIQVYGSNSYEVNDIIPAGWNATYELYNDVTPELVPDGNAPAASGKGDFTPAIVKASDINNGLVNSVVTIPDVVFAEKTPDTKDNFTGESEGVSLSFRNNYTYPGVEAGTYAVTVVVTIYKGEPSLYVIKFSDMSGVEEVETAESIYAINGNIVAPEDARVFNLSGVETGCNNLPAGIYVVVAADKAVKLVVK